mmetsp:Transcript_13509/g.37988  ORF Transcript_13509/g.37988 Transcript_13509/m.37988 type:complete len:85 (+) Transcript_13509:563-817(+)
MGACSRRKWSDQRLSSILVLLCTTLREYVCIMRTNGWNSNRDRGTLLALLHLCDVASDIGSVGGGRIFCHYFARLPLGEYEAFF